MPKNTGKGSQAVAKKYATTTWIKPNSSVGVFAELKKQGGSFKGLLNKN